MELKVKKLHPDAIIPQYQTAGAACFDLHALVERDEGMIVTVGIPTTIRTGLAFEIPAGHVMLIYSRSGHGFNADTRLANCVGVIDEDYRGEVQVRLTRDVSTTSPIRVKRGDRIAQAMVIPVQRVSLVEVDGLSETERGVSGFGSTG
jgi:dUTP pyrophosphatase